MKTLNKNPKHTFFGKKTSDIQDYDDIQDEYETPKRWFENIPEDPTVITPVSEQLLIELKEEAKKCHDTECANFNIKNSKTNSNYQFMQTIMSKGTVSDKIAAFTVAIQDNPICTLETLRNLVNMVKVGKKKECIQVIDTLTELFLSSLLRPDQKLKAFHQRPLSQINELSSGNAITRRKILSTWFYEDQLKEVYTSFVIALNNVAHDTIDTNKEKAISSMYKMLAGNPEQEKNLLVYIVNKLGDPSQQVASKAIYCLTQLLYKHSNMQEVVLLEIEKLLFRPNISTKAQYYGLCFLSQFYLYPEAPEVASRLIEVYFSFFKACIKKGEVDSRMMSALLMGVNRAYPYAKLEIEKISGHIDTIYRVVHIANNFNIGIHALSLLYQVSDGTNNITDRFYSALYKKLADPKLFTTSQQAMLLNLLYKALMKDTETERIKVFIKRLLDLSLFMQPAFACEMLYLISQVISKKGNAKAFVLKSTRISDDDNDEEIYHDVKEEDNNISTEVQKNVLENEKKCETEEEEEEEEDKPVVVKVETDSKPGWHHCKISKNKIAGYNPFSRNPLYAGGEYCAYTELINLKNHFHPSVALFASQILEGENIKYTGDPLKDFTLIRFLDRFVFKNPKKLNESGSQGAHPTFGKRKNYKPMGVKALPVTSANYLNEKTKKIPVDELFMHSYLQKKYQARANKTEDDESDVESVQSEEFEDMLDKMAGVASDQEDEDLDFMTDIGNTLKSKKEKSKKGKKKDDDEDDSEESDDGDMDDEDPLSGEEIDEENDDDELELNEDEEFLDDLDDDDDEDIEFDDESEEEQNIKKKKNNKKGKKDDMGSVFANAEEFATMLEEEGSSKVKPGSSNAFSNKDNADLKQLAWEDKRNRWLSGYNKAIGKGKHNSKGNFGKKRPGQNKFGNKSKKLKK